VALSPLEWLERLGGQLQDRWPRLHRWQRYYVGDHDLPSGPSQHAEAFMRFQRFARTNLCGVAVDSMVDRLHAEGIRTTSPELDSRVWGWWQAANLDARQAAVYRTALSQSAAYVIWAPDGSGGARVTVESPRNVITERDPADRSLTLAGLRAWYDPFEKRWLATVYVPGGRYYFRTRQASDGKLKPSGMFKAASWEPRTVAGGVTSDRSPQLVPVQAFENADELSSPVAEFDPAMDVQDRLNLTVLNRLTAERYAAFRQRWASNLTLEDDPLTGLPMSPFKPGMTQVWVAEPPEAGEPETRFGDFAQTDTTQMLRGAEADMRAFAAMTRTPVYYLPGDMVNVSADAIAALDAGHNAKCRQRQAVWGEDWESVLRGIAQVVDERADLTAAEIIWRRPENYSPAQVGDYGSKLKAIGYPVTVIAERMGDSPQQIDRLRAELANAAALTALSAVPPLGPGQSASPFQNGAQNGAQGAQGGTAATQPPSVP
jgi:hypothetical protein